MTYLKVKLQLLAARQVEETTGDLVTVTAESGTERVELLLSEMEEWVKGRAPGEPFELVSINYARELR